MFILHVLQLVILVVSCRLYTFDIANLSMIVTFL